MRRRLGDEKTDREQALDDLAARIATSNGLFTTIETVSGGGKIFYMHDKALLADSKIVWKMNAEAWAVTTNYNGASTTWNGGMTVDGDTIVRILTATGINADWINTGTLKVGYSQNRGIFEVYNASNVRVGRWDNTGLYVGNIASNLSSPNTYINNSGNITTKYVDISDYLKINSNNTSSFIKMYKNDYNYLDFSYQGIKYSYGGSASAATTVHILRQNTLSAHIQYKPYGNNGGLFTIASTSVISDGVTYYAPKLTLSCPRISATVEMGTAQPVVTTGSAAFIFQVKQTVSGSATNFFGVRTDGTTRIKSLIVDGTKPRLVKTKDYGERLLYCYENPSPMFGDVGEGKIGDDGRCYIQIDSIFAETVTLNQYHVFLQKYGNGECWVEERNRSFFVVCGTIGLNFSWEIKAKQSDFDQLRFERAGDSDFSIYHDNSALIYANELSNHIFQLSKEREVKPE